jgi:26S proteasome regulatory subunit N6
MAQGDSERVQEAQKLAKTDPRKAEALYQEIIAKPPSVTSEAAIKEYETALISLGELYRDEKCVCAAGLPDDELAELTAALGKRRS